MRATICLEHIGDGEDAYCEFAARIGDEFLPGVGNHLFRKGRFSRNPWVAEILGKHKKYKYERRFVKGQTQYKRSSSTANRGKEIWFLLDEGCIYEIRHYTSWRSEERYFVTVSSEGNVERVSEEWVKDQLG